MTSSLAQITISRTLTGDIGLREVRIWLDGELIATLRNKETVTRAVAPGRHTLRAHNTLVGKTLEFDLEAGEHANFSTANRSGCGTTLIYLLGAGPIYLSLQREHAPSAKAP